MLVLPRRNVGGSLHQKRISKKYKARVTGRLSVLATSQTLSQKNLDVDGKISYLEPRDEQGRNRARN